LAGQPAGAGASPATLLLRIASLCIVVGSHTRALSTCSIRKTRW
jgi:hypothetical protein